MRTTFHRSGFSLIELLVSTVLGLLAIAAVGNVFRWTSESRRQDEGVSSVNDSLRFAMAQITADLEMAGFFGPLSHPELLQVDAEARAAYRSSCSGAWLFDQRDAIDTLGNATAAEIRNRYPCTNEALVGTDVLAIKRVASTCSKSPEHNRFYLRIQGNSGRLQYGGAGTAPGTPCAAVPDGDFLGFYQYQPVIWYVANERGAPALCRERLSGQTMARECIASGIEDLQLEFGIDDRGAGGRPDGVVDYFRSFDTPPMPAQRSTIVAVRVALLARSVIPHRGYRNEKSYVIGNVAHAPTGDGHYRKVLSSVIRLRNPVNRSRPQAVG